MCLPLSSASGEATPFVDCLFTSVSATCVTGLATLDTGLYWSLFGQLVILCMIQIGGLGFMTIIAMLYILVGKNITLGERKLLMQSAGGTDLAGIIKIAKRAVAVTACAEFLGAAILFFRFLNLLPPLKAAYFAVFHSISAFCNAGFDIMSQLGSASFSGFSGDFTINITIMLLIILGGVGFLVWNDVFQSRFNPKRFSLHTRIVLCATTVLLVGGTVLFYFSERNHAFLGMTEWQKWLAAAFQSVTTRTAGFFTVDMTSLSDSGSILSMILMMIGGSPGSTAGGIKTTTFVLLLAATLSCARNRGSTVIFKRRIEDETVRQATAIVTIYLSAVLFSAALLCGIEGIGVREAGFEVTSAIATVGLSQNITPTLCTLSKLLVAFLMYAGRIGGLSLVLVLAERRNRIPTNRPIGKILIG